VTTLAASLAWLVLAAGFASVIRDAWHAGDFVRSAPIESNRTTPGDASAQGSPVPAGEGQAARPLPRRPY
jgi:hypothetical protein